MVGTCYCGLVIFSPRTTNIAEGMWKWVLQRTTLYSLSHYFAKSRCMSVHDGICLVSQQGSPYTQYFHSVLFCRCWRVVFAKGTKYYHYLPQGGDIIFEYCWSGRSQPNIMIDLFMSRGKHTEPSSEDIFYGGQLLKQRFTLKNDKAYSSCCTLLR